MRTRSGGISINSEACSEFSTKTTKTVKVQSKNKIQELVQKVIKKRAPRITKLKSKK